jgi:hypothetical protein
MTALMSTDPMLHQGFRQKIPSTWRTLSGSAVIAMIAATNWTTGPAPHYLRLRDVGANRAMRVTIPT